MFTKKSLLAAVLMLSFSAVVCAQTPTQFVKKVYADALNDDLMSVDIVKLHGNSELRRLIAKRDAIADRHEGEMCEWVENELIPGNDYDTRLQQMTFKTLSNNRVRAQGKNFGKPFHVDFAVACDTDACKIVDLYNPNSFKAKLGSIIKANRC